MASRRTPVRRSQLIAPYGVGAMQVSPDGVSMMTSGLDHWFEREGGASGADDPLEFRLEEWRLQRFLGVRDFRLPPDYRQSWGFSKESVNLNLTIPCVRFPQWHFCSNTGCRALRKLPLSTAVRTKCLACAGGKQFGWMVQVPFIAICDAGHVQDFPWMEWVHESLNPRCDGTLTLQSTGGASLAAQEVRCTCKRSRRLSGITEAAGPSTRLSETLSKEGEYLCGGHMPWHGTEREFGCGRPIRGSLRSASNVYFAVMRSAIYLPRESQEAPEPLIALMAAPHLSVYIRSVHDSGGAIEPAFLRQFAGEELREYDDKQISRAVEIHLGLAAPESPIEEEVGSDDRDTRFRRTEFGVLRNPQSGEQLQIRRGVLDEYGPWMEEHFESVMLVDKLRETRALVGFERIIGQPNQDFQRLKALLRRPSAEGQDHPEDWLPAYLVFGEGIFLQIRSDLLKEWERRPGVAERAATLSGNYARNRMNRPGYDPERSSDPISARFILIHTLAHVVMNRFTFESGYSSASLRERLYVSADPDAPMGAVLIYTAAGDAEGTMGGLVRMGRPDRLGLAVRRAIDEARWCSSDPVCMEIADQGGQGPESCNLAACHNCALVPETACENFNRFLDRGLLIGGLQEPSLGYFEIT